eukprot:768387-Hanusia_phi.AAC.2
MKGVRGEGSQENIHKPTTRNNICLALLRSVCKSFPIAYPAPSPVQALASAHSSRLLSPPLLPLPPLSCLLPLASPRSPLTVALCCAFCDPDIISPTSSASASGALRIS